MGKLFKESKMVFVAALLTAFAVVFSGGCGGSSDGQGAKQSTLYIYGTMPEGYDSYFASADIACRPYDSETFPVGGSILITPGVMEKMTVNDPVAKVIKENYDGNGHIVLMSPSANEITKLRSILGIEDNSALVAGLPHETTLFGIELEKDGDTHVFCHHQDNDIFDGTVDEAVSGICAVKSGDIYEIISDDTLLGTTNDVAVKEGVGGSITAVLNGASVDCHGLTDVTVGYIVSGDTVCKYDIEESPDEAEIELWSSDFVTGLKNLRKWLLAQNADDLVVGASTASAALVSQRTAGNSQSEVEKNLIDLAKQYKITLSNNDFGKSFVLNQYIIACHIFENEDSATGGRDYYYIEQRGILDSSANYLKKWAGTRYRTRLDWKKYYVGQGEVVDDYIRKYEITNKISNPPADWALEGQPSPVASNHDNTTTSSIGWSIGAGVSGGYKGGGGGPEVSGSLSFGYSCTNTKTFSTRDVEPSLTNLNNNGSELKWTYDFLAPQQNRSAGKWQRLYDGAVLGHSAFTPTNMWIWSVPTSKRNAYNSFNVTFVPTAESKLTRNSGSISPRTITVTGHGTTLSVNLPKPPLLAIEADTVSFGNAAESKTVRIGSQGGWSANVTSGSDWLSVTQNGKQLYVTVKGNTGSSARKGTINVTRNNTTDKGVIAVTQLTTPLSR